MDQHSANTIETNKGKNNILAIAPHGAGDDDNTAILARSIAKHLGCYAVINEKYGKPQNPKYASDFVDLDKNIADLNRLDVIEKENVLMEKWLNPIIEFKDEIVNNYGSCLVILLHGIDDKNIEGINPDADILLGIGFPDRRSIKKEIVDEIIKSLKDEHSVNAIEAADRSYAGRSPKNLNQLFTEHGTLNLRDDKVESIQLEIKLTGFRQDEENAKSTAKKITSVLRKLSIFKFTEVPSIPQEEETDDAIAVNAFNKINHIFFSHYKNALIEAGKYIIKTFYDDDIELARNKKPVKEKSLNKLIQMIQEQRGDAPKKSWFYNAINLVIDEHDNKSFQTYGKLNTSQKLLLLPVHDGKIKKKLIEESVKKKYSARELRERIQGLKKPRTPTRTQCGFRRKLPPIPEITLPLIPSSNSLVDSNTKVAALRQLFA